MSAEYYGLDNSKGMKVEESIDYLLKMKSETSTKCGLQKENPAHITEAEKMANHISEGYKPMERLEMIQVIKGKVIDMLQYEVNKMNDDYKALGEKIEHSLKVRDSI